LIVIKNRGLSPILGGTQFASLVESSRRDDEEAPMEGSPRPDSGQLDKLRTLVGNIKVAMLTTADEDGRLASRPLQTLEMDADCALWFFFSTAAKGIADAASGGWQVNVTYADPQGQDYVSISGTARLVRDRARMQELWTEWVQVWFPGGLDDPRLALLCVKPERAEYWDAPNSSMKRLYGLTKALVTGAKDGLGENAELKL
jgi:general stress protein 26